MMLKLELEPAHSYMVEWEKTRSDCGERQKHIMDDGRMIMRYHCHNPKFVFNSALQLVSSYKGIMAIVVEPTHQIC